MTHCGRSIPSAETTIPVGFLGVDGRMVFYRYL